MQAPCALRYQGHNSSILLCVCVYVCVCVRVCVCSYGTMYVRGVHVCVSMCSVKSKFVPCILTPRSAFDMNAPT